MSSPSVTEKAYTSLNYLYSNPFGNPDRDQVLADSLKTVAENIYSFPPEQILNIKLHDRVIDICLKSDLDAEKLGKLWPYLNANDVNKFFVSNKTFQSIAAEHYLSYDPEKQKLAIFPNSLNSKSTIDLLVFFKEKDKVYYLLIQESKITDLKCLQGFSQVKHLDVSLCGDLTTLEGIEACPALEEIVLDHCSEIKNLNPLGLLDNLKKIHANSCLDLEDISVVSKLPNLTCLTLSMCTGLRNFAPIYACTSLKELYLRAGAIDNIDFAVNLPLEHLDISHTRVTRIPPFTHNVEVVHAGCPIGIEDNEVLSDEEEYESEGKEENSEFEIRNSEEK